MAIDLKSVQCLIFDLDDTLVDSSKAYRVALSALGISEKQLEFQKARVDVKTMLGDGHVAARNRILYFKRFLENQGQFSPAKNLEMMRVYEAILEQEIHRQWLALGRDDLFAALSKRYSFGVVSNENTRSQLLKLRAIDPDARYFKWAVFSEDVGEEKPSLKIFEEFARVSNFEFNKCCMIGDSFKNDILPAQALGMQTFHCQEFTEERMPGVASLKTLNEILTLI